jgi:hypothetical protein
MLQTCAKKATNFSEDCFSAGKVRQLGEAGDCTALQFPSPAAAQRTEPQLALLRQEVTRDLNTAS